VLDAMNPNDIKERIDPKDCAHKFKMNGWELHTQHGHQPRGVMFCIHCWKDFPLETEKSPAVRKRLTAKAAMEYTKVRYRQTIEYLAGR
jgi:hypothetical protein